MKFTAKNNQGTMNKLEVCHQTASDLFFNGDKNKGIKPGSIKAYGIMKGIEDVYVQRAVLQDVLEEQEQQSK